MLLYFIKLNQLQDDWLHMSHASVLAALMETTFSQNHCFQLPSIQHPQPVCPSSNPSFYTENLIRWQKCIAKVFRSCQSIFLMIKMLDLLLDHFHHFWMTTSSYCNVCLLLFVNVFIDYDECGFGSACEDGVCVNTAGSFNCFCSPPLVLDSTRRRCIGVNTTEGVTEFYIDMFQPQNLYLLIQPWFQKSWDAV